MKTWGAGASERQEEESVQLRPRTKGLQERSPEQGLPLARCCGSRKTQAGAWALGKASMTGPAC